MHKHGRYALPLGLVLAAACASHRREPAPARAPVEANPPPTASEGATSAASSSSADAPPSESLPARAMPVDPRSHAYAKRLDFQNGEALVPIRLMEGQTQASFSTRGRLRIHVNEGIEKTIEGPSGPPWTIRIADGKAAVFSTRIQLAEISFQDKNALDAAQKLWDERGVRVRARTIGSVYGIRGKVIDNRRYVLLMDEILEPSVRSVRQSELLRLFGVRTNTFDELEASPSGTIEILDPEGKVIAIAQDRVVAESMDGLPISVRRVEFGVGYDFHGFEDRNYRGLIEFTVDRGGRLAVVNLVPLEDLLKGLVPAEIFSRSPSEALKAQAVTARGEVLAKIGTKHLGDPYLLCSEQHCAVYKGMSGETESATAAVDATRGETLFSSNGRLVDSVYSAVCGGHTEDNEAVWGGPANPSLRGKPDLLGPSRGAHPRELAAYLSAELPAACRLASMAQAGKFRWERRFSAREMDELTAPLGVGKVRAISVAERGVSGRAKLLTIAGDRGAAQVRGELNIRRLFGMLNSAMFIAAEERDSGGALTGWTFRGGGWGHGVGMCQLGAIGRAEAGQSYREILRHYFSGAEVDRIY